MSFKLNRRSTLKGLGVALPLPFLNAMAASSKNDLPAKRFAALFKPNGIHPPSWAINNGTENDFELSALMKPLTPHKKDVLILDNMGNKKNGKHDGRNFLCGNERIRAASMDQVLAEHIGGNTPMRSIEMNTEGIFLGKPDCSFISYDKNSKFIPRERDPQMLFDKLFRSPLNNPQRRQEMKSVLDVVRDNSKYLNRRIGKEDHQTLDQFYTMIRETEKKLEARSKTKKALIDVSKFKRPENSVTMDQRVTNMLDVLALALWTDSTRVGTCMLGNDNSRYVFDFLGVKVGHHSLSHFFRGFKPENIVMYNKVNIWHVQKYAYFLSKLKSIKENNGTLLDNTLVLFGSGMGHSDDHSGYNVPTIFAGGKGIVKTGRYVNHDKNQSIASMHLTILQNFGLNVDHFHKATKTIGGLNDSNYKPFVQKKVQTFAKNEGGKFKVQGILRMSADINEARLYLIDIDGQKPVKILVSFKNFSQHSLSYHCSKPVYLEGSGKVEGGQLFVKNITKLDEITLP